MAKIPSAAFLGIGIFMTIVSKYLKSFGIFVYIGYLFIAYGAAKLAISYVNKGEKPQKVEPLKSEPKDLHSFAGYCLTCGTPMRKVNVFCHRCGKKQANDTPAHQGRFIHPHQHQRQYQ